MKTILSVIQLKKMKRFKNNVHHEEVELPVVCTVTKIKVNKKTKQPMIDETGQPVIQSVKEFPVKRRFYKHKITIKSQVVGDNNRINHKVSEIFDVSTQQFYIINLPYHDLCELLTEEVLQPMPQIGFKYKGRK